MLLQGLNQGIRHTSVYFVDVMHLNEKSEFDTYLSYILPSRVHINYLDRVRDGTTKSSI